MRIIKLHSFTLIELLISVSIFAILMIVISGVYFSSIDKHAMALNLQLVSEDLNYATEIMKKDIKDSYIMASSIDGTTIYLSHPTKNVVLGGCTSENFDKSECLQYKFNANTKKIEVRANGDSGFIPLTSSNTEIENLKFQIDATSGNLADQPKITISIKAKAKNDPQKLSQIILQTTVSQQRDIINLYQGAL
ncbi:MAG TPA: type II secretion system protein [Candidatus Pacearchaeota archaeon]|nr:type II secretion system protein [Candidatus Pacearchaeota archaeon]HOK94175.1 type II secretion system protein [Candidatus Pacearchaeota archaeon]HPO75185.1 type II secretion system protein [Candidatus Pacearchaeota archaeon]